MGSFEIMGHWTHIKFPVTETSKLIFEYVGSYASVFQKRLIFPNTTNIYYRKKTFKLLGRRGLAIYYFLFFESTNQTQTTTNEPKGKLKYKLKYIFLCVICMS